MTQAQNTTQETCAGIDLLETVSIELVDVCDWCGEDITNPRPNKKYCSQDCRVAAYKGKGKEETTQERNARFRQVNRDRYLSVIDYKYEGPLNRSEAATSFKKDPAPVHSKGIDVHIEPIPPKFVPFDIEYQQKMQDKEAKHRSTMVRPRTNYCACCEEWVVDPTPLVSTIVRRMCGVYRTIDHDCSRKILNLKGQLIAVVKL